MKTFDETVLTYKLWLFGFFILAIILACLASSSGFPLITIVLSKEIVIQLNKLLSKDAPTNEEVSSSS